MDMRVFNHPPTRHGHAAGGWRFRSSTYNRWCAMKARCLNPNNKDYADYGGRGITVCERWLRFDSFLEDMGEAPKGAWLDRIDNEKGYEPGNCRWTSPVRQQRNRRNNRMIEIDGVRLCLQDWCERLGVARHLVKNRVRRGWSYERALTTPPDGRHGPRKIRHEPAGNRQSRPVPS